MRILHILDHSIPLHSGYTFRTLAILKEQRDLGWETFSCYQRQTYRLGCAGRRSRWLAFLQDAGAFPFCQQTADSESDRCDQWFSSAGG